jgi:dTDP-4-amino-4,6-dideoxygalactose transaminase
VSVYCIRVLDRARLVAHLTRAGVASAVYYPRPLHQQPALTGRVRLTDCPAAEAFCAQALALPCHGELSDAQVARVLDAARVAA